MPVFFPTYKRSGKWSSPRQETFENDNTKINNTQNFPELRQKATRGGTITGQHRFHRIGINAGAIQCKLSVNAPGDRYEQQADAMADYIVHSPDKDSRGMTMVAGVQIQPKATDVSLKREAAPTE